MSDRKPINSLNDIRTYVCNSNPGGVYGFEDGRLIEPLVEAIRAADHPAYGSATAGSGEHRGRGQPVLKACLYIKACLYKSMLMCLPLLLRAVEASPRSTAASEDDGWEEEVKLRHSRTRGPG